MSTPCEAIILKDIIHSDITPGGGHHFKNSTLASWKSQCRYYSGDANCMPNKEVFKRVSKIETLQFESNFGDYPKISSVDYEMNHDNYAESLMMCSNEISHDLQDIVTNNGEVRCEDIDLSVYEDYLLKENEWYHNTSELARCTEVGYVFGIRCKKDTANQKCIESTCGDLEMYRDFPGISRVVDSAEFCRSLGCAKGDVDGQTKCTDFTDLSQFNLNETNNEGLSLGDLNAHCDILSTTDDNMIIDLSKYDIDKHNFEVHGDDPGCVAADDSIDDFSSSAQGDKNLCLVIGALNGVRTEYVRQVEDGNLMECRRIANPIPSCSVMKFDLTRFTADGANTDGKIPLNPYYDNEEVSFGSQVCQAVGCIHDKDMDEQKGDVLTITCKAEPPVELVKYSCSDVNQYDEKDREGVCVSTESCEGVKCVYDNDEVCKDPAVCEVPPVELVKYSCSDVNQYDEEDREEVCISTESCDGVKCVYDDDDEVCKDPAVCTTTATTTTDNGIAKFISVSLISVLAVIM